jgi:hypothetical protein
MAKTFTEKARITSASSPMTIPLTGPARAFALLPWFALWIPLVLLLVASFQILFYVARDTCDFARPDCSAVQLSPASARLLQAAHVTLDAYAGFQLASQLVLAVAFVALVVLIVISRTDGLTLLFTVWVIVYLTTFTAFLGVFGIETNHYPSLLLVSQPSARPIVAAHIQPGLAGPRR